MSKNMDLKLGSVLLARINSVWMSEFERQTAINAMRDADVLVDAFVWVAKKIEQLGDRLFLKPIVTH